MIFFKKISPKQSNYREYQDRAKRNALQLIYTSTLNLEAAKAELCRINGAVLLQNEITEIENTRKSVENLLLNLQKSLFKLKKT